MEITGKVHCFFEQSGTFKNEFIKLGIPAEDYDIQNNFGETDHVIDLFHEIDTAYDNMTRQDKTRQDKTRQDKTIFDSIDHCQDLIVAFFPCIHFCDAKTMIFKGCSTYQKYWSLEQIMKDNISKAQEREMFYELLLKFVYVCSSLKIRLIIENPYNQSGDTFLENNFLKPTLIDKNRSLRGDYYVKPTAYWFFNCDATHGFTEQRDKNIKIVYKQKDDNWKTGHCSEVRSMISPDYARNWICDFVLGKTQNIGQLQFDF